MVDDNLVMIKASGEVYGPKTHICLLCAFPTVSKVLTSAVMRLLGKNNLEHLQIFRTIEVQIIHI